MEEQLDTVFWRADSGFQHDRETSAADVVRFEEIENGNNLDVSPQQLSSLESVSARGILWVTATEAEGRRYGKPVCVDLGSSPVFVAADGDGGLLMVETAYVTASVRAAFEPPAQKSRDEAQSSTAIAAPDTNMAILDRIEAEKGSTGLVAAFKDGMTHWGEADEAEEIENGIYSISTGRHGGLYVSGERYAQMPEQLRACSFTKDRFFEEDSSYCAVVLSFPALFLGSGIDEAVTTYNDNYRAELGPLSRAFIENAKAQAAEAARNDALIPSTIRQELTEPTDYERGPGRSR